jgi:CxxC motif-containing protein (DUF1111 family)
MSARSEKLSARKIAVSLFTLSALVVISASVVAANLAADPGVRSDPPGAGVAIAGLTANQMAFFQAGAKVFAEVDDVPHGLGPRFNLDSCGGCHAYPAMGGSSPPTNPQVAAAGRNGAMNSVPSFISADGPVREVRFVTDPDGNPDGGVHTLFVISGRVDAPGCNIAQEDFETQMANHNIVFRIPTPVFGAGLIEAIADRDILANRMTVAPTKALLGIRGHENRVRADRVGFGGGAVSGHENRSGNDGTITRFGWKAQNKSLLIFAGEAYNVEQGVTNELFQNERYETPGCVLNAIPEDQTNFDGATVTDIAGDPVRFAHFMRFLAPPTPARNSLPGTTMGEHLFASVGCALCHTPAFTTQVSSVAALSEQPVNLYSDLLVHHMGPGLADGITQGNAADDEFRTAPLWGLGQRIFLLHDGRTTDLIQAIEAHSSEASQAHPASEANAVIANFNALREMQKQALLNFLRSL